MDRVFTFLARLLGNFLLVCCSLAIALLLGEWAVRTWMPSPDYGIGKQAAVNNKLFEYDSLLGWKGTALSHSHHFSKDFSVNVNHDALGFRNQNPPYLPDRTNYLLLGDSYGWGWGVEDTETAATLVNQQYHNMNVYNLSVTGYGTDQEYLLLQQYISNHPSYRYEGVILLFYQNDFTNIMSSIESGRYEKPFFTLDPQGNLILQNVPVPHNEIPEALITAAPPANKNSLQNSQLLNLGLDSLGKLIFSMTRDPDPAAKSLFVLTAEEENSIKMANILLQKIRELCQSRNTRFHVVFLMTINTDEKPTLMIQRLAEKLAQENIPHSFIHSRLFPRTDLWLDTHYTPYGQKRLAHHIAEILEEPPTQ